MRFSSSLEDAILSRGFDSAEHPNELLWTRNAETSRLVGGDGVAEDLRFRMAEVPPVVLENHHEGVDVKDFYGDNKLTEMWQVLSHSRDRTGREYISTVEAKGDVAFSGTQWHPEKNSYEWKSKSIPHDPDAVRVTQFIANRFVDTARKSSNQPVSDEEKNEMIIWNSAPVYHSPLVRDFELIFVYGPHQHHKIREQTRNPPSHVLQKLQLMIDAAESR